MFEALSLLKRKGELDFDASKWSLILLLLSFCYLLLGVEVLSWFYFSNFSNQ